MYLYIYLSFDFIFIFLMQIVFHLIGYGEVKYPNSTTEECLNDTKRVKYMSDYLDALLRAIRYKPDKKQVFFFETISVYVLGIRMYKV